MLIADFRHHIQTSYVIPHEFVALCAGNMQAYNLLGYLFWWTDWVETHEPHRHGWTYQTAENLLAAAEGELEEWGELYPDFAKVADEEGFPQIAFLMAKIGEIEKQHERRYKILLANVENGKLFKRDEKKLWMCANCGFTCESVEAPEECPVCNHPRSFFAIKAENY